MSRKKVDLRLKKRSETTIFENATASRVQVPAGNSSFKRIDLISDESRTLLHKLLIGENKKFTPLPRSQLCVSSTSTDELSRPTETAEATKEDDTGPMKWIPFPPPNVRAIFSKMSRVRLTMEQLCAPISDEEDDIEEIEGGKSDLYIQQDSEKHSTSTDDVKIPTRGSIKPQVTISSNPQNGDIKMSSAGSTAMSECSTSTKPHTSKKYAIHGQPITQFLNNNRTDREDSSEAQPSNRKRMTLNPSKPSDPPKLQTENPSHPPKLQIAKPSHPPKLQIAKPNDTPKLQIAKSSNTSKLQPSRPPKLQTAQPRQPQAGRPCQPAKPQALRGDFIDLTDSSEDYQQPKKAGSSHHLSTTNFKSTLHNQASCSNVSSKRLDKKQLHSLQTEPEDEFDQLCVDIDLDTIDDFSDVETEAGSSRVHGPHYSISNRTSSSGQKSITWGHGSKKGKSSIRETQLNKHNSLLHESSFTSHMHTSSNDTRSSITPTSVASANITALAPTQSAYPTSTVCKKRAKRPNDFEVSVRAKQPRLEDTAHQPLKNAPSASTDKSISHTHDVGMSTEADGGIGSVSSPKLNTEHCPMCNTKFPAWYEQMDADEHIAQCLQAVMDLEMENDLDLL